MSRRSRLVAGFLIASTTLCFASASANAQVGVGYNRVVACVESSDGNSVVLRMAQRKVPFKPVVQYLPGANGATLLVADFPGLVFPLATRIIRPLRAVGIQEIHVGQFQDSPAISRVTVVAIDGSALKDVAFHAEAGLLQVKWSSPARRWQTQRQDSAVAPVVASVPSANSSSGLRPAPDRLLSSLKGLSAASKALSTNESSTEGKRSQTQNQKGFFSNLMSKVKDAFQTDEESAPPQAPSKTVRKASETAPTVASTTKKATSPAKPPSNTVPPSVQPIEDSQSPEVEEPSEASSIAEQNHVPSPTIELVDTSSSSESPGSDGAPATRGNVVIKLKSVHAFSTKSFRISDPERYVIDFADLPELIASEVPSISSEGSLLKSIRVGEPEAGRTRLVLDLSSTESFVRENLDGNTLSLTIESRKGLTGATPDIGGPFSASGLTIMLDAGHGGSDPGAQRGDIQEKEITLDIVKQLKKVLESRGARVLLTRADDTFVSLEDRVQLTNTSGPTVFLSVHINALESTSDIHGIETYYQTEQSRPLADFIHNALVTSLKAPDRSVRKARFYVINHTPVPAVLAEVGFISNKDERTKLISSDYQQQVAEALAQGVMLYAKSRPDLAIAKSDTLPGSNINKSMRSEERSKLLPKSFSPIAQTERTTR